ncbi:MAG: Cof-type HAD-IIB family hydrolase [Treponema sp.]|jgi:Cof subfamily protein (haloacid dehalogenase superfamily)|nr:Cof-type HAD-IIB family hydrolase [Treponema sp.]
MNTQPHGYQRSLPAPQAVKALALDLDGTALRPGAVLSDRTAAALRSCIQRGTAVILCTGRSVESAGRYREIIGAEGPMVCFNGAIVVDMPEGNVLGASSLAPEAVDYCVDLSRKLGVYYQVYFPASPGKPWGTLMAEKDGPEAAMYYAHTGVRMERGDLKSALADIGANGCIKSMFIAEPEAQDRIRPLLEERFGNAVYIVRTFPPFLEILAPGVSKGTGLELALKHTGVSAADVIAMGDEENDLPLFQTAGFSAAPANAKEAVRAAADIIIGSNTEDGVAEFLETFFSRSIPINAAG